MIMPMWADKAQRAITWLAKRLQDSWLWPWNLWRDGAVRWRRLQVTAAAAVRWRRAAAPMPPLTTLHRLGVQLFDLVGGPEIAQALLRWFAHTTPLTSMEVAAAATLFGWDGLRYQDVRVSTGGILSLIFHLNGERAFATWHTIHLPRSGRHTRANLPLLMHELTHVYQYEKIGTLYMTEAILAQWRDGPACYDYGGVAGLVAAYEARQGPRYFNREAQARIVQDYFVRCRHNADTTAYEPFIHALRRGEL